MEVVVEKVVEFVAQDEDCPVRLLSNIRKPRPPSPGIVLFVVAVVVAVDVALERLLTPPHVIKGDAPAGLFAVLLLAVPARRPIVRDVHRGA
jgi:hypothetical protein